MAHQDRVALNLFDFPVDAVYDFVEENQDAEEEMHAVENAKGAPEGEDIRENGHGNIDEMSLEEFESEIMIYDDNDEEEESDQTRTVDLSRFAALYHDPPRLPNIYDYDNIITGMHPEGEVATFQDGVGEIKELVDVPRPPVPSLEQIMQREAPRYICNFQQPVGLPYRGEHAIQISPANDGRQLLRSSDSGAILRDTERTEALDVLAYSASNATSPVTQLDSVFSASSRTAPISAPSTSQRSQRQAKAKPKVRSHAPSGVRKGLPHPCPEERCSKEFVLGCDLRKHQKTHLPNDQREHLCQHCPPENEPETFYGSKDLERHEYERHQIGEGRPGWRQATCDSCKTKYSRYHNLMRHLRSTPQTCGKEAEKKRREAAGRSSLSSSVSSRDQVSFHWRDPPLDSARPTEPSSSPMLSGSDASHQGPYSLNPLFSPSWS